MSELRLLLVEDDDTKFACTEQALISNMGQDALSFTRARDYEAAVELLSAEYFDVVVLDLLIPSMGGALSVQASMALVAFIEEQRGFNVPLVVGLTAYSEVFDEQRAVFVERLLMIERFDPSNWSWAERISEKLLMLIGSRRSYLEFFARTKGVDVVIVAARYGTEFLPVVRTIKWIGARPEFEAGIGGTTVCRGRATIGGRPLSVVVASLGQMGLSSTAAVAALFVERYRPEFMVMLGMCCGFASDAAAKKSLLLDVCIATSAVCWDEGKYYDDEKRGIEGFSYRPTQVSVTSDVHEICRKFIEEGCGKFQTRARRVFNRSSVTSALKRVEGKYSPVPKVSAGLNVSGNCIVSRRDLVNRIIARNPSAISLEMEIFAFLRAIALCDGFLPKAFCIKSVADFGEEKDPDLFDPVQPIASEFAFLAFDELMERFFKESRVERGGVGR